MWGTGWLFWVFCVTAANNNCIPAHSGGNGSLIILHGARGSKPDPRLTDAVVGRSHDLRHPGSVSGAPASSNDVLSTLTELKPLQTYNQQSGYLSPYSGPYDGAGTLWPFIATIDTLDHWVELHSFVCLDFSLTYLMCLSLTVWSATFTRHRLYSSTFLIIILIIIALLDI